MQFQFADCVLDTDRRELRRADHVISVEPQVFDVLEYLVRNRNRVVSKDDLIADVWSGRIISESALGTRINAVRSAVGDTGKEQRLIRTLHRKGIRFVGEVSEVQQAAVSSAPAKLASMLNQHPVFAVLPFSNLSDDPAQEYFADGLSEDLIAAISRWCRFPVIARNSSFIYKGRAVDIRQIGKELGARYVVEGSVRKSGNRMRIAAQLVDSETGHHLWADRYDRDIGDVFAVQDEITASIAAAVEYQSFEVEASRAVRSERDALTAYDLVQRGNWHLEKYTRADLVEAQRLYGAVIEIDSTDAPAHTGLAAATFWIAQMRWGGDFAAQIEAAHASAQRAVALDSLSAHAQMFLGQTALFLPRHDLAIAATRRAIELNPSLARAYAILAYALDCVGRFDEALATVDHSLRLRPHDRTLARCLPSLAYARYQLGEYEAACDIAQRAMNISPAFWTGHQMLAASLGQLNRKDEAQHQVAELRRKYPATSRDAFSRRLPFRDEAHNRHINEGLAKAGWVE